MLSTVRVEKINTFSFHPPKFSGWDPVNEIVRRQINKRKSTHVYLILVLCNRESS